MSDKEPNTCSAEEAVKKAATGENAFAFISTRGSFEVGQLVGGKITVMRADASGTFVPTPLTNLSTVYDLRLFNTSADWHWRRSGVTGHLSVREALPNSDMLPQKYLLWGKTAASADGWTEMRASRVKPFWVPVAATKSDQHLYLTAVEHVGCGVDGNAFVAFERLTGIEVSGSSDHGV